MIFWINDKWEPLRDLHDVSKIIREHYNYELADELDKLLDNTDENDLEYQLSELEDELAELENELAEKDDVISNLKNEIEELENRIEELENI